MTTTTDLLAALGVPSAAFTHSRQSFTGNSSGSDWP